MELFKPQITTTRSYSHLGFAEEFPQHPDEPLTRLTNRELAQLRAIREEVESRPRRTRFEARYIRVMKIGELEFSGIRTDCVEAIASVRKHLKQAQYKTDIDGRSITIAFIVAAIAKFER